MHLKTRIFLIMLCFFLVTGVVSGCRKNKQEFTSENRQEFSTKNSSQTVKDYSYLKPHIYDVENEKFSEEANVQMGRQYEGLRVFGELRRFNYYSSPILRDNLSDYLKNIPIPGLYDRIISLFYDTRTILLNKQDLTELFELWKPDVYVSLFQTQFYDGLNVRVYNILDDPLIPTKSPIKIIQTWDDKKIYCQLVDTYLTRRFTDIIPMNEQEKSDKLLIWCYNLGVRGQDLSTELQYWEFKDNRWFPCELEIDIRPAFPLEEYFFGNEKRSNISNAVYPDGIAFYKSIYGDYRYIYEKIETIKENEIFRVSPNDYPEYYVDLIIVKQQKQSMPGYHNTHIMNLNLIQTS